MKRLIPFLCTVLATCLTVPAGAHDRRSTAARPVHVGVWLSVSGTRTKLAHEPDILATAHASAPVRIEVDPKKHYQTIMGFGAALTDASAILMQRDMTPAQRERLIRNLFDPVSGIGLSMLRLPIGASDFSTHPYSLDAVPKGQVDPGLRHFSLAPIERTTIPTLKEIRKVNPGLKLVASPWSPPAWMKTSDSLIGGTLLPRYHKALADYLLKFVEALGRHGIPVYALTLQNEPGFSPSNYPGMKMGAATRADVIARYLGPALAKRKPRTLILDWDHNWDEPGQPMKVFADPAASRYVAGVAWHCYEGDVTAQTKVHNAYPHKQAFLTECSDGLWQPVNSDGLVWFAGQVILGSMRNWARGVMLWNLALDQDHGPHSGGCENCLGVVSIDRKTGKVTRKRDYYALAHFSRFVRRGAVRIGSSEAVDGVANVAFQNAGDDSTVMIAVNEKKQSRDVAVHAPGVVFSYRMPPQSVVTFVWPSTDH